jgi:RNA polymerase sigma-70 factor (ECF subfamily)
MMVAPVSRKDRVGLAGDAELVALIAAGDQGALAEAYRRHGGLVFGLARRVLRDERFAEDVAQEVFVSLWEHPERFDPSKGSVRSWLGLLAHRRSVDRVRAEDRRIRRDVRSEDTALAAEQHGEIDVELGEAWLAARVRDAVAELPTAQRDAVVLAYYRGRTYRQVAAELSIPEGTAKSRLRLALHKLEERLRPLLSEEEIPAWI